MIPAKRTRLTAPILALGLMMAACSGADPVTATSENATTTVESTAATGFDLDAIVTDFVGDSDGGAAVLIVRNGTTTTASAGNADSSGRAISIGTPFRVGSISKPFVAAMVMQMVDEGVVDIDQPLATYLPNSEVGADTRVRSLLGHTTGIPNYTDQPEFFAEVLSDPARTYTPTEVLSFVADVPTTGGEAFSYSNTNYILLGQLVEEIDGVSLNEALQNRISGPLGLTDTAYVGGTVANPEGLAAGWSAGVSVGDTDAPYESIATSAWSAGALVSTAPDLQTFLTALSGGELVSFSSLTAMTDTADDGYGFGLFVVGFGADDSGYGHNGSIPGFSSTMAISPDSGDLIVILTNSDALIADALAPAIVLSW